LQHVAGLLFTGLVGIAVAFTLNSVLDPPIYVGGIVGFVLFAFWYPESGLEFRIRAKLTLRATPAHASPLTHTVSRDALRIESPGFRTELDWKRICRVVETADFFVFFYSKCCAYGTPKRAFASQEQISSAREIIQRHLPPEVATWV
jgi:hypothetical protein